MENVTCHAITTLFIQIRGTLVLVTLQLHDNLNFLLTPALIRLENISYFSLSEANVPLECVSGGLTHLMGF